MGIIQRFLHQVEKHPQRAALICRDQRLSYAQCRNYVTLIAEKLYDMGVKPGSHVIVALPNSIELAGTMLAIADLGAVIVPLATATTGEAFAKAVQTTDSTFLITQSTIVARLKREQADALNAIDASAVWCMDVQPPAMGIASQDAGASAAQQDSQETTAGTYCLGQHDRTDDSYILTMTSGSTSDPKPIVFSQRTKIERSIRAAFELYGLEDDEVILVASPMHHSLGQRLVLLPLMTGGTAVILSHFTADHWLKSVSEHRITFTIAVASHLEIILRQPEVASGYDLSSLRTIVSSSALLRPEVKQSFLEHFKCALHECYGASEVGIVTNAAPDECRDDLRTVGRPIPGVEMRVVDEAENEVEPGTVGEIICRTPTAYLGYYKNRATTQHANRNGFFHTGDMGCVDAQGRLFLCGRKKDIIIVGGTNVYPDDIELVLNAHEDIAESAVIGVPDAYFGEAILAIVVPREGCAIDLGKLAGECNRKLADFQRPMAYEVVSALPRNSMGKLTKQVLREQFKDCDATAKFRSLLERKVG